MRVSKELTKKKRTKQFLVAASVYFSHTLLLYKITQLPELVGELIVSFHTATRHLDRDLFIGSN